MKTDYLRISIIDKCNLKCFYCHPFSKEDFIPHESILRFEEIEKILDYLGPLGISKIRLTGGEPLMKKGIETLISKLKASPFIDEVNMTTNGILLKDKFTTLEDAGIDRINISMNTMDSDRYEKMMGRACIDDLYDAVELISKKRRHALKINTILFKGINEDEILEFTDLAVKKDICVRFIEYYTTNSSMAYIEDKRVCTNEVKSVIEDKFGKLIPGAGFNDNGPSETYSIKDLPGRIGFISAHSKNYCGECSRLRLSSDGKLFPCLFSKDYLDLKSLLRNKFSEEKIKKDISGLIGWKRNCSKYNQTGKEFSLRSIGG